MKKFTLLVLMLAFCTSALHAQWYDPFNTPIYQRTKSQTKTTSRTTQSGNTRTTKTTSVTTKASVSSPSAYDVYNFLKCTVRSDRHKKDVPAEKSGDACASILCTRGDLAGELNLTESQANRLKPVFENVDVRLAEINGEARKAIEELLPDENRKEIWRSWLAGFEKDLEASRSLRGSELQKAKEDLKSSKEKLIDELDLNEKEKESFLGIILEKDARLSQLQSDTLQKIEDILDDRQEELIQLESVRNKLRIEE